MDREDFCPVCGAENHACRGSADVVKIIGADLFPSLGHQDMHRVEEDIWIEEEYIETDGSQKSKRRCIARAGEVVPLSEAVRRGIISA